MTAFRCGLIATLLVLVALPALAQIEERRVQFAPGTSSATVEGQIQGDEIVDYLLNARAGQAANISMAASTGIAYFNLIAPSETDVAFHIGSRDGNQFEGVLPESGDYRVRVYLMGDEAPTTYRLEMIVADIAGRAAPAPSGDDFTETDFYEVAGVAAGDVLNLREGPSTASAVRSGLESGTLLENAGACEVHGSTRWCPVEVAGRGVRGWVAARYLREPGPGSATAPAPEAGQFPPYPEPDRLRTGATPPYLSVFGVSDALDIRAAPSTRAAVVAAAPSGTLLRNYGCRGAEGRRWCEVERVDGDTDRGWAAAEYLEAAGGPERAGQGIFDAGGWIDCAQAASQPLTRCGFGVAREGGGTATVVVTKPDDIDRMLFFQNGEFLGANTSQADGYPDYGATKDGDVFRVSVGDERYEIVEAVIFGG